MMFQILTQEQNSLKLIKEAKNKLLEITDVIKESNCENIGLLTGNIGIAIFAAHINTIYNNIDVNNSMENALNKCFSALENDGSNHKFADGLAGICWGINHLVNKKIIDTDVDLLFEDLEIPLLAESENDMRANFFDFIHGGLGASIYAFDRLDNIKAKIHISKTVNYIYEYAEILNEEVKWKTIININEGVEKIEYNLGLSHGIPSIIWVLCKSYDSNIETEKCSQLIKGSINWILKQKLNINSISLFPSAIEIGRLQKHSRLGWCYGDLGIASIIWQAGKSLNNEVWKAEAIKIMTHASNRKNFKDNGIFDAGLCHGTAGIAHIYNRFYFETKLKKFKETANFWIGETLKLASYNDGLAGFKSMSEGMGYVNEYSLLEGVSGIGLALYSHISDEEPTWDRCLLLS